MSGSGARRPPGLPGRADVVVVGGGIAGVSTAFHLATAGVDVLLVERDRIGSGATGAAVGWLTPPLRQPFHETVRFHGAERAALAWSFALDSIASLARALEHPGDGADLHRCGALVASEEGTADSVRDAADALEAAGLPITRLDRDAARERAGSERFTGGFLVEGCGAVHPADALTALAALAREAGAGVVEGCEAEEVERAGSGMVCRTTAGEVRCEMVVYATHVESRRFSPFLGDEVVPVRGQALRARTDGPVPAGVVVTDRAMNGWWSDGAGGISVSGWRWDAWDRSYWRARPEVDEDLQGQLEGWLAAAHPDRSVHVEDRWSGIYGWTADTLPVVGPLPGRATELVAAGFSGGGLALGFGAGALIAETVAGTRPSEAAALFNPRRFT